MLLTVRRSSPARLLRGSAGRSKQRRTRLPKLSPRVVPVLRADVLWSPTRQNVDEYPHKLYVSQSAPLAADELALPAFA
jgi:hypothetical protein